MKKFLALIFALTFLFGVNPSTSFAEDYDDDEDVYEEIYDDDADDDDEDYYDDEDDDDDEY